jgi:transposase-like protein
MAPTRDAAYAAFDQFATVYDPKHPKATARQGKDPEALLAFYEFPAEH